MSTDDAAKVIAKRWQGMKIIPVGIAISAASFALVWFLEFVPGLFLFFAGWVVSVWGGFIHVRQMFREARLKQSDLHPRVRATISISTGEINGYLPKRALAHVQEWRLLHQEELLKAWSLAISQQPLPKIEPLE